MHKSLAKRPVTSKKKDRMRSVWLKTDDGLKFGNDTISQESLVKQLAVILSHIKNDKKLINAIPVPDRGESIFNDSSDCS